jgi:hypothetical protein
VADRLNSASRLSYVVLDTIPTAVALSALDVRSIARATDLHLNEPLPSLNMFMPLNFSASEPEWALHLENGNGNLTASVYGRIRIEHLSKESLLDMPVRSNRGFELFSNVILADGRAFALVINANELLRMHRELG